MPRVWTTKENTEFLESEFDGFLTSQRKSRVQLFMAGVFDRWFQRFPIEDEPLRDANDNPLPMTEGQRAETLAPDLRKQFLNEAKTKKMAVSYLPCSGSHFNDGRNSRFAVGSTGLLQSGRGQQHLQLCPYSRVLNQEKANALLKKLKFISIYILKK